MISKSIILKPHTLVSRAKGFVMKYHYFIVDTNVNKER